PAASNAPGSATAAPRAGCAAFRFHLMLRLSQGIAFCRVIHHKTDIPVSSIVKISDFSERIRLGTIYRFSASRYFRPPGLRPPPSQTHWAKTGELHGHCKEGE